MMRRTTAHGTIRTGIEYWPSYVDILTTVLMVFILQNFLQTTMNVENMEAARIREAQRRLKETLQLEFQAETTQGKITLDDSKPNMLQIRFSEKILFRLGDYRLAPEGREVLSKCALVLRPRPSAAEYKQIEVQGHTDSQPLSSSVYPHNNWELSSARALAVVQFMMSEGLSPKKLSAGGYAEHRPVPGAQTALNRRVELRILFATPDQAGDPR